MEDDGVFEKIDDSLWKVNELATEVPTTSNRLGCIAGIFPEAHGPREEPMKEAIEHDVAIIDSLRSATSHIRTAFNHLKKKQDAICKGFENVARIIVSQISKQKNDASAPVRGNDYTGQWGEEVRLLLMRQMTMKMRSKSPLLNLLRMILVMTMSLMTTGWVVILMGVARVLMTMLIIWREFLHQTSCDAPDLTVH
nr:uncharacterized protein LOC120976628 isoform X1 [Aegilops tauschii subsp. strangulata]